jgi:hypothetical protein
MFQYTTNCKHSNQNVWNVKQHFNLFTKYLWFTDFVHGIWHLIHSFMKIITIWNWGKRFMSTNTEQNWTEELLSNNFTGRRVLFTQASTGWSAVLSHCVSPLQEYSMLEAYSDRLCGLVVRAPGYWSRGPGFDSQRYQIFWELVGLKRGPLSLVRTTEELLERKSSGSGLENRN